MNSDFQQIQINVVGVESCLPYSGVLKVKTILTRRDRFVADERRRMILGVNPEGADANTQAEAMILGQLFVRIVDGPDWWKNSDSGLEIPDDNVILEIFTLVSKVVKEHKEKIKEEATKALEQIKDMKE